MRLGQDAITSLFPQLAKIPDLKKISIEFTNNSSTSQPINILETFLNQSIQSQYPPLNNLTDLSRAGGSRAVYSARQQNVYTFNTSLVTCEVYNKDGDLVTSISLGDLPNDITISDENDRVFISTDSNSVIVIDTTTNTIETTISTGSTTVDGITSKSSGVISLALNGAGTMGIREIDADTLTTITTYNLGAGTISILAWSPLFSLYFLKDGTNRIQKFKPSTTTLTLLATVTGTISDIKYLTTFELVGITEIGGNRDMYFYTDTALANTVSFNSTFNPRYITENIEREELLINDSSTSQVAFVTQTSTASGTASEYVTTSSNNIASAYFDGQNEYIIFNQASTTITLLDRRSSISFKMNGSENNYNYLLNDIMFNPLLCYLLYIRTTSDAQISNSMNLEISQATGQTFIDTKYPDAFLDINQTFANIVMVPMNFVFDGSDFISNYILNAGVTVSMIFYVRQFKRSRMMQPEWLKRNNFGDYLQLLNEKSVIFEQQSSPVLPSVERPPIELLDGEDNNQLAEEEYLGFDGSIPYRRAASW